MALPFVTITKLIVKLTSMVMASDSLIGAMGKLINGIKDNKKGTNLSTTDNLEKRVSQLEQGMALTAKLSEETNEQLRIIESLFENIKKSLRILSYAIFFIGLIVILALVLTVVK